MDGPEFMDPEAEFQQPDAKAIATAITITSQVGTNRNMVLQTYIPRDFPVTEYHAICDKLVCAANRQEAMLQLEEEETNLALEEKTLKQQVEDFNAIEPRAQKAWEVSNRKGPYKMNAQEAAQKVNAETNIRRFQEAIEKRKQRIAKYQAVIAKVD